MNSLVYIVEILVITQIILVIIGIISLYVIKIIFNINRKTKDKNKIKTRAWLKNIDNNFHTLNPSTIAYLKDSIDHVVTILHDEKKSFNNFESLTTILSEKILKPAARELTYQKRWFKRYLAVLCYSYGVDEKDDSYLKRLIQDKTLLVNLNAGKVIFKYPTPGAVNSLIDSFSQERHLQESAFSEILTLEQYDFKKIESLFEERIKNEPNNYIKAFCFRILSRMPLEEHINSLILDSCNTDNIELNIAILHYIIFPVEPKIMDVITKYTQDPHWEVRAIACKKLGQSKDLSYIPLLVNKLSDENWWVRIDAAESLAKFGEEGIRSLENITPDQNREAYDTAQVVLNSIKR